MPRSRTIPPRILPTLLLGLGLLSMSACSRTSDGGVVLRKPPSIVSLVPSWMRPKERQPVTVEPAFQEPVVTETEIQPEPPAPPPRRAPKPLRVTLEPKAKIDCVNVGEPGKRIKMVCK